MSVNSGELAHNTCYSKSYTSHPSMTVGLQPGDEKPSDVMP